MENNDPKRKDDVKDPIGVLGWPLEKGRDGERTPMQWNAGPNAGFTKGTPWLPVPASAQTHNVESEQHDPNSVLNFYRRLLLLRKEDSALREGKYVALNLSDSNIMSYLRQSEDSTVLIVLNMSATKQEPSFDLAAQGLVSAKPTTLLENGAAVGPANLKSVALEPYGVYIAKLNK
jgi:alpha-glucosidase